ncbi:hypothetical protein DFJ74DRAFT_248076 [Hyaloraphidium curvatum]|nr:hypothetical protein DFJ74DRAFT_248076 [Hyaloraphidium curvatum]
MEHLRTTSTDSLFWPDMRHDAPFSDPDEHANAAGAGLGLLHADEPGMPLFENDVGRRGSPLLNVSVVPVTFGPEAVSTSAVFRGRAEEEERAKRLEDAIATLVAQRERDRAEIEALQREVGRLKDTVKELKERVRAVENPDMVWRDPDAEASEWSTPAGSPEPKFNVEYPKEAIDTMLEWIADRPGGSIPTKPESESLAQRTGLTAFQVLRWIRLHHSSRTPEPPRTPPSSPYTTPGAGSKRPRPVKLTLSNKKFAAGSSPYLPSPLKEDLAFDAGSSVGDAPETPGSLGDDSARGDDTAVAWTQEELADLERGLIKYKGPYYAKIRKDEEFVATLGDKEYKDLRNAARRERRRRIGAGEELGPWGDCRH